jgi:hypothetical protein
MHTVVIRLQGDLSLIKRPPQIPFRLSRAGVTEEVGTRT